jgi:phage antirepressor YoqD-like protein
MPESTDTPNSIFLKPEVTNEVDKDMIVHAHERSDGQQATMSSREIAELLDARHDNVRRTIERLADRSVIVRPPLEDEHEQDAMGRSRATSVYRIGKRDSYVIVAQLSPEFTGRLVDRWQELETQQQTIAPILALNDPGTLRALLLDNVEERMKLAQELAAAAPKLEAFDRIASAEGSLCITDAAKSLQVRPKSLFDFLRAHGWIYQPHGGRGDIAYAPKLQQGLMEHKTTTVHRSDGSEKIITQARITPKGLARLAQEFPPPVKLAA